MKICMLKAPIIFSSLILLFTTGCATPPGDTHARNLAATCAACHGTNGNSVGAAPMLAGIDKEYFVKQMTDFKSGARKGTVMNKHAKGYYDSDFEKLGSFFASQTPAK